MDSPLGSSLWLLRALLHVVHPSLPHNGSYPTDAKTQAPGGEDRDRARGPHTLHRVGRESRLWRV